MNKINQSLNTMLPVKWCPYEKSIKSIGLNAMNASEIGQRARKRNPITIIFFVFVSFTPCHGHSNYVWGIFDQFFCSLPWLFYVAENIFVAAACCSSVFCTLLLYTLLRIDSGNAAFFECVSLVLRILQVSHGCDSYACEAVFLRV